LFNTLKNKAIALFFVYHVVFSLLHFYEIKEIKTVYFDVQTTLLAWGIVFWLLIDCSNFFNVNSISYYIVNISNRSSFILYYLIIILLLSVISVLVFGILYVLIFTLFFKSEVYFSILLNPLFKMIIGTYNFVLIAFLFIILMRSSLKGFIVFYIYQVIEKLIAKFFLKTLNYDFYYLPLTYLDKYVEQGSHFLEHLSMISIASILSVLVYKIFERTNF
jgi:hypothetical protein